MTIQSLLFAARRWGFSAKRRASSSRSILASAGIAAGVTALIVVMGVMGGLQKGYIDSILEISSFHIRVEVSEASMDEALRTLRAMPEIASVVAFKECHVLATGPSKSAVAIDLRSFQADTQRYDPALVKALGLSVDEEFPRRNFLVLGKEAASLLGVGAGSEIGLFGIRQSPEEGILPVSEKIVVGGLFASKYYDFDSAMGFVTMPAPGGLQKAFSASAPTLGIKLKNRYSDYSVRKKLMTVLPEDSRNIQTWRDYNRSFFGALRTEKTVMMLLISLIFVVVGINIYHAMRRTIAAKMADIAVLKAFGASNSDIRKIFALDGFLIGVAGAVAGTALGLLLSSNINAVLNFASSLAQGIAILLQNLGISSARGDYRLFSPAYFYIDKVPVSISAPEVLFIAAAAIASTGISAVIASRRASESKPSEVFRNE